MTLAVPTMVGIHVLEGKDEVKRAVSYRKFG